jgi:hypothetical protein
MTNQQTVFGGDDFELNLEKFGLKPYNSEVLVAEEQIPTELASSQVALAIPVAVPVVIATASLMVGIASGIMNWIASIGRDGEKRETFTKSYVTELHKQFPDCNFVVIHTHHSIRGHFEKGHSELPMTIGTCGYEVYSSPKDRGFVLTNHGDGGFINWAFIGSFVRHGDGGKHVTFCSKGSPLPEGNFAFSGSPELIHSNGQGHYCWFASMEDFARLNGGDNEYATMPGSLSDYPMTFDGKCGG